MPVSKRRTDAPRTPAETRRVMAKLFAQHPNADTELHFRTPYQLLVATILSAQCTDERVNRVTPALFARYPDARALARATTAELEPQIQSTGFFRSKSKALVGMAQALVAGHHGEVPAAMDDLVKLPGVGRKTANVVLGHALGVPGLPVDRHVLRVANRIGIATSEDPEVVEEQLGAAMPHEQWTLTSDTLILHGRRICKPRPLCDSCAVRDDCEYYQSMLGAVPSARKQRGRANTPPPRTREGQAGRKGPPPTPQVSSRRRNSRERRRREGQIVGVTPDDTPQVVPRGRTNPERRRREGQVVGVTPPDDTPQVVPRGRNNPERRRREGQVVGVGPHDKQKK